MSRKVIQVPPGKSAQWDAFVEHHPGGLLCHLSSWKRALERSYRHMKGTVLAVWDPDEEKITGGVPVFTVTSALSGKRLVSVPFATLCSPLVDSDGDRRLLFSALQNWCKETHSSYLQVRWLDETTLPGPEECAALRMYKHHFLVLDKDLEELKHSFHRKAVRVPINKAEKSDLVLKIGDSEADLRAYYSLYYTLRKQLGLPSMPYRFFQSLWEEFAADGTMQLFFALYKGEIVGTLLLLVYKDVVSLELSGSCGSRNLNQVHFLYWEAIRYAWEHNYKVVSFGQTHRDNTGLMTFKDRWGTVVEDIPICVYPKLLGDNFCEKEHTLKYKLLRTVIPRMPDFVYEPLGRFCYQHAG